MTVTLRRATVADVAAIGRLVRHPEVASSLSAIRPSDDEELREEIERADADPETFGVYVIQNDGLVAGTVTTTRVNRRSRIVAIGGLVVDPDLAGRGIGLEALRLLVARLLEEGAHRLEAETYGFNTRAQSLFERAGFTRDGVRRQAYWRHGDWVDGICFGLVADDVSAQRG